MKTFVIAVSVAAAASFASPAMAGFINNEDGVQTAQVSVIGKVSSDKAIGLGNGTSLNEAIRQIVPKNYGVNTSGLTASTLEAPVTWRGGKAWVETIKDSLESMPAVQVTIDGTSRMVTLTEDAAVARTSPVKAATVGVGQWTIRRGQRLSEAMTAWGRAAGWNGVFWEYQELESDLAQTFPGTFEEAITSLMETLVGQGLHIHATFHEGNRTVRIWEKK